MALASGLNAQVGFGEESTWGTSVTPTRFLPLVSESIKNQIERLESRGIIAGARVLRSQQWAAGKQAVNGDVELELYDRSLGLIFKHALGSVSSASAAGPVWTHTYTPGDLAGKGLTIEVGKPFTSGTMSKWTYSGCKITSFELACTAGEIATARFSFNGKAETAVTGNPATASYTSGIKPLTFIGGSLTIGGSSVSVSQASISGDNGLNTDRYFLGAATEDEPLEANWRGYTGFLTADFETDLTVYNRYVNGTEAALVLTFEGGTISGSDKYGFTITTNARFDGETPNVTGPDVLALPMSFKCVGASADSGAISIAQKTSESTP